MGEVYRARDMRLERTVAIGILPAQFWLWIQYINNASSALQNHLQF